MKRSEINNAIKWAEELCEKHCVTLPDFARYAPEREDFAAPERKNLVETMLGWDVTDFNGDDFEHLGAVLFTVRNGSFYSPDVGTPYAEKYIFMKDGCEQEVPMHYHVNKTEDIINRAGGVLCIQMVAKGEDGRPDFGRRVPVYRDGVLYEADPNEIIEISNGNSITIQPYVYHRFYAKTGAGDLIVGEVSKVNDDNTDNVFAVPRDRFCAVAEDEPPYRLLVNEYKA